jgi:hypothetical protein
VLSKYINESLENIPKVLKELSNSFIPKDTPNGLGPLPSPIGSPNLSALASPTFAFPSNVHYPTLCNLVASIAVLGGHFEGLRVGARVEVLLPNKRDLKIEVLF